MASLLAAAMVSVPCSVCAADPPDAPAVIVGKDGLLLKSVSASYPVVPVPSLVLPNDWLELARRAGLPADNEQFRETLEVFCQRRRQEASVSRQRLFQKDFDQAAGLLPAEGASLDELRRKLKARMLRHLHDELQTDFESFKQGVTAAAGKAGALEALNEVAIAEVGMHHLRCQIRILLAACIPGPFPSFMTMDLESRLTASPLSDVLSHPGIQDALAEYRASSHLELKEILEACATWQRRESDSSPEARNNIARAMDRLISYDLAAIEKIAAPLDSTAAASLRASEVSRFLVPARPILSAHASVVAIAQSPEGKGVREVDELIAAFGKSQQSMMAAHRSAWTAYFRSRAHGGETAYSEQMQSARRTLDSAIGAMFASLGAQELAGDQLSARVRLVAELSSRLSELGKLDETGVWRPASFDPSWPGDILRNR